MMTDPKTSLVGQWLTDTASDSSIEISDALAHVGTGDFSITAHIHTADVLDHPLGDIAGRYDIRNRQGFNFGFSNFYGVASSQPNHRHLSFGVDAGSQVQWSDCGRPGNSVWVSALAVCEDLLYAGTYEGGESETGHVYRYAADGEWIDCGSPDPCNAVLSLAVYERQLYAGVGNYRAAGSGLGNSANIHSGGKVYRYVGGTQWEDCGKLQAQGSDASVYSDWVQSLPGWKVDDIDTVGGLAVFDGKLYAMPLYHRGVFRYDGSNTWTHCGDPGCRLFALGVFAGGLYGAGNEGQQRGGIYRYEEATGWSWAGGQAGVDQVYSFAMYQDQFFAGTWPDARIFRLGDEGTLEVAHGGPDGVRAHGDQWHDVGKLGDEQEVMGMAVYNGQLYAGSLPLAKIYRYDGPSSWTPVGDVDTTPDVRLRRAWTMAVYQGRLFCGTLPSGRVHAMTAGQCVTCDKELTAGWHHVAAVRRGPRLEIHVDGELVAVDETDGAPIDVSADSTLTIGTGPQGRLNGSLRDVRVYSAALTVEQISLLR